MIIMGIDPGVSGALAYLSTATRQGFAQDLPVIGGDLSAGQLFEIVRKVNPDVCVVERVNAFPGQGVSSVWRFGRAYGAILAVLACSSIRTELVTPTVWKKAMGLPGKDKEQARELALRLFPDLGQTLARKKDHGRAEALLIAEFWRRKAEGARA